MPETTNSRSLKAVSPSICSIGDIMLGENVHHFGRGIATKYYGKFENLIPPDVRAVINEADLVIGNLECSLMPDSERRCALSRGMYAAPESALDCFSGITPPIVLNVANNHFGQHGQLATEFTVTCLENRGIYCIGQRPTPLELAVRGKTILLWGASLVKDGHENGYVRTTADRILHDLDWGRCGDGAYRVLSLHWGEEYRTMPSGAQKALARRLAARGVDLIIGHHPHVVQPVRSVEGIRVAYSHGNFIFDQNFSPLTRIGLMLVTTIASGDVRCFQVRSRKYRIHACREITIDDLEAFCRRGRYLSHPLLMRILMKLEMVAHGRHVPDEVWRHFIAQLLGKRFKVNNL